MKVISIWQPWASLIVHGHKRIETRGWPAPRSIIGRTIGIASTKSVKAAQRRLIHEPEFARHYAATNMLTLEKLPLGCVLGTVFVEACDPIDEKLIDSLSDQERVFGWFEQGRFAWRLLNPRLLDMPAPVVGKQGLWEWHHLDGQAHSGVNPTSTS